MVYADGPTKPAYRVTCERRSDGTVNLSVTVGVVPAVADWDLTAAEFVALTDEELGRQVVLTRDLLGGSRFSLSRKRAVRGGEA